MTAFGGARGGHGGVRRLEDLIAWDPKYKSAERFPLALIGGTLLSCAAVLVFNAVCLTGFHSPGGAAQRTWLRKWWPRSRVRAPQMDHLGHGGISAGNVEFVSLLSGARVPYAMARDGLFFRLPASCIRNFARLRERWYFKAHRRVRRRSTGTSEELIFVVCVCGVDILCAFGGGDVPFCGEFAPDLPRPYRTWGYPVLPALFVAGPIALTLNIWIERRVRSTIEWDILSGFFVYCVRGLIANPRRRSNNFWAGATESAALIAFDYITVQISA